MIGCLVILLIALVVNMTLLCKREGFSLITLQSDKLQTTKITNVVPSGGIVIWSGAKNQVPSGWALCNGQNGTPDLTGRFVRMYSDDKDFDGQWFMPDARYAGMNLPNDSLRSILGINRDDRRSCIYKLAMGQHGGSDRQTLEIREMPRHNHRFDLIWTDEKRYPCGSKDNAIHKDVASAGNTADNGGGADHNNAPPFYVLAYIMKLPTVHDLTEGQPVKCGTNYIVYRYTGGILRAYPNPTIASSWDPNWGSRIITIDCIGATFGADMEMKQ